MSIYKKIAAVSAELAKEGIDKSRSNQQQGYKFRGIDDIYNALAMPLAKNGLVIIPRVMSRSCEERTNSKGNPLFFVTVDVEFDICDTEADGKHTARVCGEAMDSADKATNKAMSAAYKYMAIMTFCIPVDGDNDADATTHELSSKITEQQAADLAAMVSEVGADLGAFCKYFKLSKLSDMPSASYSKAISMLEEKRKKAAQNVGQ